MASINLGRVGFSLRGEWSADETYSPLDVVLYNGDSYAARVTSKGIAPAYNSNAWQELTNVASAVSDDVNSSSVRYDTSQSLSGAEKSTARANIDAPSAAALNSVETRVGALESGLRTKVTVSGTTLVVL